MRQIGILLDWAILKRAYAGIPTFERLNYYEELGKQMNLAPVFFHPLQVDFRTRKVRGYVYQKGKLIRTVTSVPPVIHNRILTGNQETNRAIEKLGKFSQVYNGIVIRNKAAIHQYLWANSALHPYLPRTATFSQETLIQFLKQYPIVYVKPVIGSVGQGVGRIEQTGEKYLFITSEHRMHVTKKEVIAQVGKWVNVKRFLVQQGVMLAKYQGQTFDIRVSVQKDGLRQWGVSGFVCKIANPENKLSNLAKGGRAEQIDKVLASLFPLDQILRVKAELTRAAIEIAIQYNKYFPSLADLGMDMGIDPLGNPYLIEINVRDQRYSFYKAGSIDMFRQTYLRPLEYGRSFF
ncbi:YheC/YheD family protein [Brevibacillus sp. SYSU BS000544]|uniref:YheC/YheD family endospore coat-associated protein n=1 Tax=Brevibacillus sp. SYSU BS000544 TaxID=3416443 RepID=UPI003CE4C963